jgi:hypothetical protein
VSNSKLVPRTEAVALGLVTDIEVFIPAGGFTSTLTRPACRFTCRVSFPAEERISVKVSRVKGRTARTALPTSIRAVLLKPVEITVSSLTMSPAFAGTKAVVPAVFSSTVPLSCCITAFWANALIPAKIIKTTKAAFFIFDLLK